MAYDPLDTSLVVFLARAGGCSLATSPGDKDNWVERSGKGGRGGRLPNYICKVAKGVMRSGKSKSQAIGIAVSQIKKWAAGGDDVEADTRAKAAKALAQWEALKAKNAARKVVKATHTDGVPYLALSSGDVPEYDMETVRSSWQNLMRSVERSRGLRPDSPVFSEWWVQSIWTTFIIVADGSGDLLKVPYEVIGQDAIFGAPVAVRNVYQEIPEDWDEDWDESLDFEDDEDYGDEFTENEERLLLAALAG